MGKAFTPKRKDITRRRTIAPDVKLMLGIRSAGRCEFDKCNEFLFRHPVTGIAGNFAEIAHVVAFSPTGPRPNPRLKGINEIDNLMLLCARCHKLIDGRPEIYTIETLKKFKKLHEKRVYRLTGLSDTNVTTVIRVVSRVRGHDVSIQDSDIDTALYPRFCDKDNICNIDLRPQGDLLPGSMLGAAKTISNNIEKFNGLDYGGRGFGHVSVFALAPIPLLVHLGANLSTKISTDLFQRHRDTESWKWKSNGKHLGFRTVLRQDGSDRSKVALLVSMSGPVSRESLPTSINSTYSIYEITIDNPGTDLLRTRKDLESFRGTYESLQGQVMQKHVGKVKKMDLFAAVPAPIAVMLGWARLPQVAPALKVYENVDGKFKFALEVN